VLIVFRPVTVRVILRAEKDYSLAIFGRDPISQLCYCLVRIGSIAVRKAAINAVAPTVIVWAISATATNQLPKTRQPQEDNAVTSMDLPSCWKVWDQDRESCDTKLQAEFVRDMDEDFN
jgi:hypothetical protein